MKPPPGWSKLTSDGRKELLRVLADLPDDTADPAPLCERMNDVRDSLLLTVFTGKLPQSDREIVIEWTRSERSVAIIADLVAVAEVLLLARKRGDSQ